MVIIRLSLFTLLWLRGIDCWLDYSHNNSAYPISETFPAMATHNMGPGEGIRELKEITICNVHMNINH